MNHDPDVRRLRYVRYADDFLLGFIGPKSEAEEIKQQLRDFLRDELTLELSEEKTLITHARSEAARFLGYQVTTLHNDTKRSKRSDRKATSRSINGGIGLEVPKDVLEEKCQHYMRGRNVMHRPELEYESDYKIVLTYQLEFRGIANYYRLAYNMHTLRKLRWVMETSLTKTLAHKLKVRVPVVYERYGAKLVVEGKEYKGLQASIPRKEKPPSVSTWGGIPLSWTIKATLQEQPTRLWAGRSELVQRLLAQVCEHCGGSKDVEVHHIRAMKDIHHHAGRPKPPWMVRMIALKRKTLLLCRDCHDDLHAGRPMRRQGIELAEVKARQKAKTRILESRMR